MLCNDGLFHAEALLETIDASAGINQLLLTGVEGMALGADFDLQLALDGAGFESFTAHAANDALAIVGMDLFLHCYFTSFAYAMIGFLPHELFYHNCRCNARGNLH